MAGKFVLSTIRFIDFLESLLRGIKRHLDDSTNRQIIRVDDLQNEGVRFISLGNGIPGITRLDGVSPDTGGTIHLAGAPNIRHGDSGIGRDKTRVG